VGARRPGGFPPLGARICARGFLAVVVARAVARLDAEDTETRRLPVRERRARGEPDDEPTPKWNAGLLYQRYIARIVRKNRRPRKLLISRGLFVVAGAGFEPATFGL
jgi:hypothetical protein